MARSIRELEALVTRFKEDVSQELKGVDDQLQEHDHRLSHVESEVKYVAGRLVQNQGARKRKKRQR